MAKAKGVSSLSAKNAVSNGFGSETPETPRTKTRKRENVRSRVQMIDQSSLGESQIGRKRVKASPTSFRNISLSLTNEKDELATYLARLFSQYKKIGVTRIIADLLITLRLARCTKPNALNQLRDPWIADRIVRCLLREIPGVWSATDTTEAAQCSDRELVLYQLCQRLDARLPKIEEREHLYPLHQKIENDVTYAEIGVVTLSRILRCPHLTAIQTVLLCGRALANIYQAGDKDYLLVYSAAGLMTGCLTHPYLFLLEETRSEVLRRLYIYGLRFASDSLTYHDRDELDHPNAAVLFGHLVWDGALCSALNTELCKNHLSTEELDEILYATKYTTEEGKEKLQQRKRSGKYRPNRSAILTSETPHEPNGHWKNRPFLLRSNN